METVTQNYNDPIIPPHAGEGACPATPHGATQGQKPLRVREENGDERETPSPSTKFVIENSPSSLNNGEIVNCLEKIGVTSR